MWPVQFVLDSTRINLFSFFLNKKFYYQNHIEQIWQEKTDFNSHVNFFTMKLPKCSNFINFSFSKRSEMNLTRFQINYTRLTYFFLKKNSKFLSIFFITILLDCSITFLIRINLFLFIPANTQSHFN